MEIFLYTPYSSPWIIGLGFEIPTAPNQRKNPPQLQQPHQPSVRWTKTWHSALCCLQNSHPEISPHSRRPLAPTTNYKHHYFFPSFKSSYAAWTLTVILVFSVCFRVFCKPSGWSIPTSETSSPPPMSAKRCFKSSTCHRNSSSTSD